MTGGPARPRGARATRPVAPRACRGAALALALLCGALAAPRVRADDAGAARERFWKDGDAAALAGALGGSAAPADREDAALARLAANPAAPLGGGDDAPPLARAVAALARADLATATAAAGAGPASDVRRLLLEALLDGRRGKDDDATRRLLDGPAPILSRDGPALSILGAALADDDRDLLGGLLRAALVRAGEGGRAELVAGLAEAAAALDADAGGLALVPGARILRRTGRPADALALLDGAAAARVGRARAALGLERGILAWRRNDASTARAEAAASDRRELPWIADALAKAGMCCAVVPAPPVPISEGGADADATALARLVTTLGSAVRPEDVATRAAAKSTTAADPAFVRAYLDSFEIAHVEVAGDPAPIEAALAKGLPVLLWRIRREGERFVDHPLVLRGHDPTTGLLLADEADPRRPDVIPSAWTRKCRALLVAPRARAAELAPMRDGSAARRGASLATALSALYGPTPEAAAALLAARPGAGLEPDAVLDLYAGFAVYAPAFAAHDPARLAEASAILRRSGATAPNTPLERLIRAEASAGGDPDAALAELAAAEADEGRETWIEITRFLVLESAHRHADALAALGRARTLAPLDVHTLYFRAGTRRLLGDGPGARADLVRVLERRPDHVPAAEDLAGAYVEDGDPARALAVVKALVAADSVLATSRRVRQLRQRVELRLVRRARSADDLAPLATSPEPDVRAEVAWTASSFDTDAAETLLRSFLSDPDEAVRRRAALAYQRPSLGDRAGRDPNLVSALVARLAADASAAVREALVRALGRVASPTVVPTLSARLAGPTADPAVGVRAAIAESFATLDGADVRRALVSGLSDGEVVVRTAAIRALSRLVGTTYGFVADDPPDRRAAAIAEWHRRLGAGR